MSIATKGAAFEDKDATASYAIMDIDAAVDELRVNT
jgi:hypothetical protein